VARIPDGALLIGVFYSRTQAEDALRELEREGFRPDQVSVALCDAELGCDPAAEPETRAKAGAGFGAAAGGLLGVLLGAGAAAWFPELGLALAAALAATATVAAAGVGALVGGWVGSTVAVQPALTGSRYLSRGVVAVRPEGRDAEAAAILCRFAGCAPEPAALPRL